jgi:hypothetical protein
LEQERQNKTNSSGELGTSSAKKQGWSKSLDRAVAALPLEIPTCNFFAPLRAVEVNTNNAAGDGAYSEPLSSNK